MIRKSIFLMIFTIGLVSCNQSAVNRLSEANLEESIAETGEPKLAVVGDKTYDFGDLKLNEKVKHTFTVKNVGTSDLVILEARASCGCTVPDNYTKTPIQPGKTGTIPVEYNATSAGVQTKTVTVTTNSVDSNTEILTIKANVKS